jgi:diadenylate cyclase
MSGLNDLLRDAGDQFGPAAALDIIIIWLSIFWVLLLLRNTTAMSVIRGATIVLIAAFLLGRVFDLRVLNFLLRNSFLGLIFGLFVIFREEIRRALDRVGRTASRAFGGAPNYSRAIEAIARAASSMSKRRVGALIVMERETGLQEYVERGIALDAVATPELLQNIFFPNSPLHDGAAVLHGDRVIAARVTLPLSENPLPEGMGRGTARHCIAERTDAVSSSCRRRRARCPGGRRPHVRPARRGAPSVVAGAPAGRRERGGAMSVVHRVAGGIVFLLREAIGSIVATWGWLMSLDRGAQPRLFVTTARTREAQAFNNPISVELVNVRGTGRRQPVRGRRAHPHRSAAERAGRSPCGGVQGDQDLSGSARAPAASRSM